MAGVAAALRTLAQAGIRARTWRPGCSVPPRWTGSPPCSAAGRPIASSLSGPGSWNPSCASSATVGTAMVPLPPSPLRVVARSAGGRGREGNVLATYLTVALTHTLRGARPGRSWQHTVFVLGADRLRGDTLDRLSDACEKHRDRAGPGLPFHPAARQAAARARERRGGLMRLGNAEDAKAASEQLGTEHRFVLSQLTETIGLSVTDTTSGSYTSTTGSVSSRATSWSSAKARPAAPGTAGAVGGVLPLSRELLAQHARPAIRAAPARASRSAPGSTPAPRGG